MTENQIWKIADAAAALQEMILSGAIAADGIGSVIDNLLSVSKKIPPVYEELLGIYEDSQNEFYRSNRVR